jgi:hypothetical protein
LRAVVAELEVAFGVVEGEAIAEANGARIAVPGEAVLAIFEGDGARDDVRDGDVLAA